jgi:hypothetical protein
MMQIETQLQDGKRAWRIIILCDHCKRAITELDGWFVWEVPSELSELSHFSSIAHTHDACLMDFVFIKPGIDWVGCKIKDLNNEEGIETHQITPTRHVLKTSDVDKWLHGMYSGMMRQEQPT